jgi:hypothetical protein
MYELLRIVGQVRRDWLYRPVPELYWVNIVPEVQSSRPNSELIAPDHVVLRVIVRGGIAVRFERHLILEVVL